MKLGCCPPFGWVHCNLTNSRVDLVIDQIEIRAVCLPALVWLLSHTRVDKSNHSTEKWRQDKQHCCCCSQANLRGYRIKCTRQQSNSLSVVFFFLFFFYLFPLNHFFFFLVKCLPSSKLGFFFVVVPIFPEILLSLLRCICLAAVFAI